MNKPPSILDEYYHGFLTLLSLYGWKLVVILGLVYVFYHFIFLPYLWKWIQTPLDQQRKEILDKHKIRSRKQQERKLS